MSICAFVNINKSQNMTSSDAVVIVRGIMRRFTGEKHKVGHMGTLDPMATGVLPIAIGKSTRLFDLLSEKKKTYIAEFVFGQTTDTLDAWGEVTETNNTVVSKEDIESVLPSLIGEVDQIPPTYSAKSVDGVRAYELARKLYKETGENPEATSDFDTAAESLLRVSRIHIAELELLSFKTNSCDEAKPIEAEKANASSRINVTDNSALGLPRAVIRMACSKGTYVRAFARDLGETLGSGAHLDSLQRSRSGEFRVENALSVEQAISLLSDAQRSNN